MPTRWFSESTTGNAVRSYLRNKSTALFSESVTHNAMKRGIRPIARTSNQPVFHRIVMDVVQVPFEVVFILERVLPKTALPDAAFLTP